MENLTNTNLISSSIEQSDKNTPIKKPRKKTQSKPTVKISETDLFVKIGQTETLKEPSKKRAFTIVDYTKEYEWIPSDEIDLENPLKFIFTLATNKELANYNDNLMRLEGNSIVTYQNLVDIELLNLKLIRIENIEIDGEVELVESKPRLSLIVDKVLDLDLINELSGYIRVMSNHKGKLF